MDIKKLMQQAQEMQKKVAAAQGEFASKEFRGTSGGGYVELMITGKGDLKSLKINPELLIKEEVAILEDLIIAAHNDAKKRLEESSQDSFGSIMPAGMKLPF